MVVDYTQHRYKIITAAVFAGAIGIILILLSTWGKTNLDLLPYLSLNVGGIFFIGGVYSLISELFLKKNFADQIQVSINEKMSQIRNYESLQQIGLSNIVKRFQVEDLVERIKCSDNVSIFSLINHRLFSAYALELREMIEKGLKLDIFLFNYESDAIEIVKNRFRKDNSDKLKENIKNVITHNIHDQIINKISEERKDHLKVSLYDKHPTYSAYIFDDSEYWFVPIFFQEDRQFVPVFVFKGKNEIKASEFYKDFNAIKDESKEYQFE